MAEALKLAIDVLHFPAQVRSLRSAPLPADVLDVVRVAAGDSKAIERAADATGRSRELVREAAAFFVEQVLLYPGADSYRVLGATPDASHNELRRNMALLLRWLHPDGGRHGAHAVFASKVTEAWDHLKTKERRAAYDRLRHRSESETSPPRRSAQSSRQSSKGNLHHEWRRRAVPQGGYRRRPPTYTYEDSSLLRRVLMLLFGRATP
jgi:hypothetical protein